jgi:hypothetical protein
MAPASASGGASSRRMVPMASGPAPAAPAKVMCNLYGGLRTRHTAHQEALRAGEAAVGVNHVTATAT